jgi:ketosteroid isomerase-like protein
MQMRNENAGADRVAIEQLLQELYAARLAGQLGPLCELFSVDARFRISGSSSGKPIAIAADGIDEIRPWLAMLLKTFKLSHYEVLSRVIDGPAAAVHWRAAIHSRITGAIVATELVDLIEIRGGRIASYRELFVPY